MGRLMENGKRWGCQWMPRTFVVLLSYQMDMIHGFQVRENLSLVESEFHGVIRKYTTFDDSTAGETLANTLNPTKERFGI
jgi:hypothetical protein